MRRSSRFLAVLLASTALAGACGDSDDTGDADAEADTQVEGDRDTAECVDGEEEVSTGDTLEESGDDPQGAVEGQQPCASGSEGDTDEGGDGEVNVGGPPGVGTPSDSGDTDSGGSDTGTGG